MKQIVTAAILTVMIFSSVIFYSCEKKKTEGAGTAMFYACLDCGKGILSIYVDDKNAGTLTSFIYSCDPADGQTVNVLTYNPGLGTHTYKVFGQNGGLLKQGSFEVTADKQTKINVDPCSSSSGGGGGGSTTCSSLLKSLGSVSTQNSTGVYGDWGAWYKVADVGNGAMYISFKLTYCFTLDGELAIAGYPKYRIKNTCTNGGTCKMDFSFEYSDCDGVKKTENIYAQDLDHAYTDENSGMWFMGKNITQSFVSSSIVID